jgi:hypothetical protein
MKKTVLTRIPAFFLSLFLLVGCASYVSPSTESNDSDQNSSLTDLTDSLTDQLTDSSEGTDSPVTTATPSTSSSTTSSTVIKENTEEIQADNQYLTADYTTISGQKILSYPRLTNLPTLYITLSDGLSVDNIPHGVYVGATYTLVSDYIEDSYYEKTMSIKGRGNYSWSFQQKPYSLKLDEKADFLGMGDAKKWVLVTVSSDRTMLRNYLTQKLAKKVGLPGTCDNEYVDVVVNGSYLGTYVLTEKIQFQENRIDVNEEKSVLFEIEMVYRHSCEACVILYEDKSNPDNSIHLEIKNYHGMEVSEIESSSTEGNRRGKKKQTVQNIVSELQSYFDRLNTAMQTDDYDTLCQYMDMDSFINWYLVNELTRNYDSAFVTSCYCYIDENNILHMGPCWDYDTCYGAQFSEYDDSRLQTVAPWYRWLFNSCPEFVTAVKNEWTNNWTNDGGYIDWFLDSIDSTSSYISQSEQLEHTKYLTSEVRDYASYSEAINYLKTWLGKRISWMDKQFLIKTK